MYRRFQDDWYDDSMVKTKLLLFLGFLVPSSSLVGQLLPDKAAMHFGRTEAMLVGTSTQIRRIRMLGSRPEGMSGASFPILWCSEPYIPFGYVRLRMRRSLRNLNIACDHTGRTHFGGSYFFHEFVRVLHTQNFLAPQIRFAGPTGVGFTG